MMLVNDLSDVSARYTLAEARPGHYRLLVKNQPTPSQTSLQYDFLPTREFERNRLTLEHREHGLLTGGDLLRLTGIVVDGDGAPAQHGGGIFYRRPLGASGLYGSINLADLRSRVELLGQEGRQFDGQSVSLVMGYPLTRDVHGYRYLIGELQRTEEDLEGFPNDNRVDLGRVVYAHKIAGADAGLYDASVALTSGSNRDSGINDFSHLRAGLGKIWPIHNWRRGAHLEAEMLLQVADGQVPASEQFYLGSTQSLRGYAYAAESGDEGVIGQLELGFGLQKPPSWLYSFSHGVFLDAGAVRSKEGSSLSQSSRD